MVLLSLFVLFLCIFCTCFITLSSGQDYISGSKGDSSSAVAPMQDDNSPYPLYNPLLDTPPIYHRHESLIEVLHLDELFEVFESIPHLQLFDDLRYAIGYQIGVAIYNGLTSKQISTLNNIFSISNSDQLGNKIAQCFDVSFIMNKNRDNNNDILTQLASKGITELLKVSADSFIDSPQFITIVGSKNAKAIKKFINKNSVYAGTKLSQCLLTDAPDSQGRSHDIKQILLNIGQHPEFIVWYQYLANFTLYTVNADINQTLSKLHIKPSSIKILFGASKLIYSAVGTCISQYGWGLEPRTNMMIQMVMELIHSNVDEEMIITKILNQVKRLHIRGLDRAKLKYLKYTALLYGDYYIERILQCLLLPLSEKNRTPFFPVDQTPPQVPTSSGTNWNYPTVPVMYTPNNNPDWTKPSITYSSNDYTTPTPPSIKKEDPNNPIYHPIVNQSPGTIKSGKPPSSTTPIHYQYEQNYYPFHDDPSKRPGMLQFMPVEPPAGKRFRSAFEHFAQNNNYNNLAELDEMTIEKLQQFKHKASRLQHRKNEKETHSVDVHINIEN